MENNTLIAIALLTALTNAAMAVADFVRAPFVLENSAAVRVPESWLTPLGCCKLAGATGIVIGLAGHVEIGLVAAGGLVLFFLAAIGRHVQTGQYRTIPFPAVFLACGLATLGGFAG